MARGRHERPPRQGAPRRDHGAALRERAQAASQANVAYGIHAVRALVTRHPHRVRQLWLGEGRDTAARLQELRQLAQAANLTVRAAGDEELDRL
ncbi:MAG TPA: RNA methyltransferase substrate-binding domain-containing protein, partial [Steroidobacteraceae bacterium]|nr:RNA methyltransferase substrate-binding domain-containing protein [Steroidobacteraceae bacterium]